MANWAELMLCRVGPSTLPPPHSSPHSDSCHHLPPTAAIHIIHIVKCIHSHSKSFTLVELYAPSSHTHFLHSPVE